MEQTPSVVELELDIELVLSPERSVPVPARLSYGSHDPLAVHVTFHLDTGNPVTWVFARELLVEGTFRPCGQGDVRIWPKRSGRRGVLCLALSSPAGDALLEAPLAPVAGWLERAHRLVPPGGELAALDMDHCLAELLA
ncbi:SsgA family sporulation/cell division regulator [Kitasatospora sp. NPDC093679]|uniref:SsgA family sporulation/cell division regulator n=1 Tax=unclassified Kitasatospora TaxID=2633591 RepID=UPI003429CE51